MVTGVKVMTEQSKWLLNANEVTFLEGYPIPIHSHTVIKCFYFFTLATHPHMCVATYMGIS